MTLWKLSVVAVSLKKFQRLDLAALDPIGDVETEFTTVRHDRLEIENSIIVFGRRVKRWLGRQLIREWCNLLI